MVVSTIRQRLLALLGGLLEPIVLLLLKSGITWREFAEVAKARFVDVATHEFGIRDRPTNASRVAILTGIDRREVASIRKKGVDAPIEEADGFMSKPTQLLDAWYHESEFREADGKPRVLPLEGEGASFAELARRFAPGIPPVALHKELRAAGAIEDLARGRVRVLKRNYVPRELNENQLRLWSAALRDVGTTLEHNITRPSDTAPRFDRRAINLRVDRAALPAFQKFLESEGQAFLERVDDWLSEHQVQGEDKSPVRVGVGVYQIQDKQTRRGRTP
jgi:hypothetical protein